VAFDADLPGVDGFVGFEVVERAACSPGPGAEGSPVVEFARLAFVAEADDAFGKAGSVVGLNAAGEDNGVAPAFRE
jgi:hypothetical protein